MLVLGFHLCLVFGFEDIVAEIYKATSFLSLLFSQLLPLGVVAQCALRVVVHLASFCLISVSLHTCVTDHLSYLN